MLNGALYVGSPAGAVRFDLESGQSARLTREQGLAGNKVFALSGHPASGLWVATDGGLSRLQDGAWANLPAASTLRAVRAMVAVADGVWAGGPGRLARFRGGTWKSFLTITLPLTGPGLVDRTTAITALKLAAGVSVFGNGTLVLAQSTVPARGNATTSVGSLSTNISGGKPSSSTSTAPSA